MLSFVPKVAVTNRDVSLEFVEQGDRHGPTVVFLHGYTDSWRSFELLLPRLPRTWRAIAVTQRGHGGSSRPVSSYGIDDYAADVVALLATRRASLGWCWWAPS